MKKTHKLVQKPAWSTQLQLAFRVFLVGIFPLFSPQYISSTRATSPQPESSRKFWKREDQMAQDEPNKTAFILTFEVRVQELLFHIKASKRSIRARKKVGGVVEKLKTRKRETKERKRKKEQKTKKKISGKNFSTRLNHQPTFSSNSITLRAVRTVSLLVHFPGMQQRNFCLGNSQKKRLQVHEI